MAVMIAVGIGLLLVIMGISESSKLEACYTPVTAEVVDYGDWGDSDGREYRPIVEYTHQGEKLRHNIKVDGIVGKYWELEEVKQANPVGKTVTVYINPEKPKFCCLDAEREQNGVFLYIALGILLIILVAGK